MNLHETRHETLKHIGENGLLHRILPGLAPGRDVVLGVGDDCAVVRIGPQDMAITSDAVIEGRHFDAGETAERIGHKALARALSDLAAMGADPDWALVNLTAPGHTSVDRIEGLYRGLNALARRFDVGILGGDTAEAETLSLHVFAMGRLPPGTARSRSAVRAGDLLFVTGKLGASHPTGRHLDFVPRIDEGRFLRDRVHAMMDLSDGLATDAPRMALAADVRLEIDVASLPLDATLCALPFPEARRHALCDGEDFELFFAVPPETATDLQAQWSTVFPNIPLTRIGTARPGPAGVHLRNGRTVFPLTETGFEHFV